MSHRQNFNSLWCRSSFCVLACLLLGISSATVTAQPMINTNNQRTSVSDSFYEYNGVNWGFNFGNPNGNGSRSFGGFSFGAPAIPPFGGYSPNSGAQFGFARLGKNPFHFGLEMGYGSKRSLVSNGVNTTSINGIPSSIFSGVNRNFVTGYTPVVTGYSGYNTGYPISPYGPGYYSPYVPYGYRINVHRHPGSSTSELIRRSGHVGAHDHGHKHDADWKLGGHYEIYPIYGPACSYPVYNFPGGYPTPYGHYGNFGPYVYSPYATSVTPYVGQGSVYADSYRNVSTNPIPGTIAAGIIQSQANATEYWNKDNSSATVKPTTYASDTSDMTLDPLGRTTGGLETKAATATSASTATDRPESLIQIRKRLAEEERIETVLRQSAIQRLIDQARDAYKSEDYEQAIQLSQTALERCLDSDKTLKETILRGIKNMKAKEQSK